MAKKNENLYTILEGMACPRCNCNDADRVKTVNLGHGSFIRSCSLCNWATGIDDSVNLCDLGEEDWEFEPKDGENGSCVGNTKHRPICMGFSRFGQIGSLCSKCKKTGIMYYKGQDPSKGNAEFQNLDSVFGAIFKNITTTCDTVSEVRALSGMLQELVEHEGLSECMPPSCDDQGDKMVIEHDGGTGDPEPCNQIQNSSESVMEGLQCDANDSLDLDLCTAYVVCENCNNSVEDYFDKAYESGKVLSIKCLQCETAQKLSNTCHRVFENTDYIHKARVSSWDMIERGNHISWQRNLFYEHHAIVLSVHPHDKSMKVVEYGAKFAIINGKPKVGIVQEREEIIEDLLKIFLYRYDYDPDNCFSPEEVTERAQSRIEERLYDVFAKNCEHFATWCKTGNEFCTQIIPIARRVGQSAVAFVSQLSRPLINLIKDEVFQIIISGATVDDVVDYTVQQMARVKVDRAFMVGRIGFTVLVNLVVELCMFYKNYNEAKTDFDIGKITKSEFNKRKYELIGESSGGLTLGLLLGFTWLFGLGIVGTLMLNILGIVGGRLCGAWIGRKLHSLKLKALLSAD